MATLGAQVTWKEVALSTRGSFWRRHSRRLSPAPAAPEDAVGFLSGPPALGLVS